MRIAIDVRCLMGGRKTGVEEYTLSLLSHLFELDNKNEYVLFFNSWQEPGFDFSYFSQYKNVQVKRFKFPNKILNFLFWYLHWPHIDRLVGGADIVFMPNIIFGAVSQKTKLVLTLHDLSFERYNDCFSWKRRAWHLFINPKKLCRRADKIIAVSQSTKNDMVSIYGLDPSKITVVYSAVDKKFQVLDRNNSQLLAVKEKYNLPFKFILYLGTIEPRKNIVGLIRAFNRLQKDNEEELSKYKLVIAGAKGWLHDDIFREIEKSPFREKIMYIDFVEDSDKEYLYNLASLFVYPSFFEGFGFPPLEAMSCGLPVISSNNSSLPEIVGRAGIMIDPDKPDEIYRAMREILGSRELRENLAKRGLARAKEFDWEKTSKDVLDIFENV